jgi:hypothetical protein
MWPPNVMTDERLAPTAVTCAETIVPADTLGFGIATAADDIGTADHGADHTADDRAGRSGNDGAGARADSDTFNRPSLGRYGRGQHQHNNSSLKRCSHDKLL